MRNTALLTVLLTVALFQSCSGQPGKLADVQQPEKKTVTAADIPIYDFAHLAPMLHSKSDTTFVVNFWATWCKPCVAELPVFEAFHEKHKLEKVKVILVSLDFPKQVASRLVPFINNKNLQPQVVLLDDPDANSWIDKVSPEWSGAIPATVVFKNDKRGFFERSFDSLEDLEKTVAGVVK